MRCNVAKRDSGFELLRVVVDEGFDWRTFVKMVLRAARKVPRRVRMRPHVVK